jgi:hypothetical protein
MDAYELADTVPRTRSVNKTKKPIVQRTNTPPTKPIKRALLGESWLKKDAEATGSLPGLLKSELGDTLFS